MVCPSAARRGGSGGTVDDTSASDVVTCLRLNPILQASGDETLAELAALAEQVHLTAGQTLFRQGDVGDAMYVLGAGELSVHLEQEDGRATTLNNVAVGEHVGEMALLTGQPRTATVRASADCDLIKIPKTAFDAIAARRPDVVRDLVQVVLPLFRRTQLAAILTRFFGQLDAAAIHDLETRFDWLTLRGGEALIRQGERGDTMFIVISGRFRVSRVEDDGAEHILGEVSAGDIVGEFSLLTDERRSASVYAIRDSTVARLSRAAFELVMERYPRGLIEMTRLILTHRPAIAATSGSGRSTLNLALVPIEASVRLGTFAERLVDALSGFGPALHLNAARVEGAYGKAGIADLAADHPLNASLLAWLDEAERRHRYVVYEAEANWSNWTQRCVRQADRVLLVANAAGDGAPGEIEEAILGRPLGARNELVLLQAEDCRRPAGTRRWLDRRAVAAHHHVRPGNDADVGRLARRVTGRAWGLVLSGGGARGYAHVGVYRALVDAGIPVDLVGGTSMGAIVGAFIAMGHDYETMRDNAARLSSPLKLFDPTLPVVSLFSSQKVTRTLMDMYSDTEIADLWRPFFSVSSNLTRAEQTVHRKGKLWEAVRASMAIPGIFSPVLCDGELQVDGAILNNLPIDVMHEVNQGGPNVAVNVIPEVDLTTAYHFGHSISGLRALASIVNPADSVSVPLIFENLLRVLNLNEVHRAKSKRGLATIYVRPPVGGYGILEFSAWRQIVDAGYRAAVEAIEGWRSGREEDPGAPVGEVTYPADPVRQLGKTLGELEKALNRRETREGDWTASWWLDAPVRWTQWADEPGTT